MGEGVSDKVQYLNTSRRVFSSFTKLKTLTILLRGKRYNAIPDAEYMHHIEWNQLSWVHVLPCVHFDMMNTLNKSTGFMPFQLHFSQSLRIIPPLVPIKQSATIADIEAWHVNQCLETDVLKAQDNLLKAKISQSDQANKHQTVKFPFAIGSQVCLSTLHQCKEYKAKGAKHVAKFMPQYDGPYTIIDVDENHSTMTLDLPNSPTSVQLFTHPKSYPTLNLTLPYFLHDASKNLIPL